MLRLSTIASASCAVLAVLSILMAANSAAFMWHYRHIVPFYDSVDLVRFLDAHPHLTALDLFEYRPNEHRPVIPLLLYIIDYRWFGARGLAIFPVLYALNFALALLAVSWVRMHGLAWTARSAVMATSVAGFFSLVHFENLVWEIQIFVIASLVFASLACFVAASVGKQEGEFSRRKDVRRAAVAALLAACASYSFMFGLVAFPVIAVHGFLARWRPAALSVFITVAAVTILAYALDYRRVPQHTDPLEALAQIPVLLDYVGRLLGSPLLGLRALGVLLVWFSLVVCSVIAYLRYRRPHWQRIPDLASIDFCLLIVAFAFGSAVLIGLGRLTVASAIPSRYMMFASIFSMGLFGLFVLSLRSYWRLPAIVLVSTVALLMIAMITPRAERIVTAFAQRVAVGGVAATYGVHLGDASLHPAVGAAEFWTHPRGSYPSYRDSQPFVWIGRSIAELPHHGPDFHCTAHIGEVSIADVEHRLFYVRGWGLAPQEQPKIVWGVLVDPSGLVMGLGRLGSRRTNLAESQNEQDHYSGLFALVRAPANTTLSLWLIDNEGRACSSGASTTLP